MVLALGLAAVAASGLLQRSFGGAFEGWTLEVAREQYRSGEAFRVPTLAGMPFVEKPPLFFDLLAGAFHLAGGPSVAAARLLVAVVAAAWLGAAFAAGRAAGGPRAGWLAAALLGLTPVFVSLARRIALDGLLALFLTAGMAALVVALGRTGRRPRGPAWLLALVCCGAAFLVKGILGAFLFLAPLAVHALLSGDRRAVRALLRPSSLLVLAVPVALWAWTLHASGGRAFLAESFLNNSVGRFVGIRFDVAGTGDLPYGDVDRPEAAWFYLHRAGSLAGPSLLALLFWFRGGWRRAFRSRGRRGRAASLALCFALVPPAILTFSSQKGVHHLGSCSGGFALAGALAAARLLLRRRRWREAAAPLVLAAALLLVAGMFAFRDRRREEPEIPRFGAWLREEAGDRVVGMAGWGDGDLGGIGFAMDRTLVPLRGADGAEAFLAREEPALCILGGGAERKFRLEEARARGIGVFARVAADGRRYTVLANAAALRETPGPRRPPPPSRREAGGGGEDREEGR